MPDPSAEVVLITGASSGLGYAMATRLRQRGYRVYGTSRHAQPRERFPWPMFQLDVQSDHDVETCIAQLLATEQRIDVLINNAGCALIAAVEETSIEDTRMQMETNFFGAVRMMMSVLPTMRRQNSGHIVNISSISGLVGMPFAGAYSASKHALEGISESLAHELRGAGIRVTLIEPDGMRTGIRLQSPRIGHPALAATRMSLLARLRQATALDGKGTSPEFLASTVCDAIESDTAPLRILIGEMAKKVAAAWHTLPEAEFAELLADMH